MFKSIREKYLHFSASKSAIVVVVMGYILLHACVVALNNFATDDYLQRSYAVGSTDLEVVGLLNGIKTNDVSFFVNNQFNFFDPKFSNGDIQKNYGVLPWWTKDQAMLHLWRPVSSLTHWLDYQCWPNSPNIMQWHNGLWLLLSFVLVFSFFKQMLPVRSVFVLALIIYGLDVSISPVVGWIAARNSLLVICFLALTLICFHRSWTNTKYYWFALIGYVLAILSAEAGIVVLGYLFAYMFFYPVATIKQKGIRVIPFVVITVIWRWYYHAQGYGANNIGQYIDPAHSPLLFLAHAFQQFPILFIEVVTGIDAIEVFSPVKNIGFLALLGWSIFFGFALLCYHCYQRERQILFWFFGSVFSLAPGLIIYSSDPRVVVYAHIGFSVTVALLIIDAMSLSKSSTLTFNNKFTSRITQETTISLHQYRYYVVLPLVVFQIVLQFFAMLLINYSVWVSQSYKPANFYEELYGFKELIGSNDFVVLLNHRDPFRLMYYPYMAAVEKFRIPNTLRQISSAQTAIKIKKTEKYDYLVEPDGGFIFHPKDKELLSHEQKRQYNRAGNSINYAAFFHDGIYQFVKGDQIILPEMDIIIADVDAKHRPLSVDMKLQGQMRVVLLYWDWPTHSYKKLPKMAIGETFVIPGPM